LKYLGWFGGIVLGGREMRALWVGNIYKNEKKIHIF